MTLLRTGGLFTATAFAEILGCYLPYLWLVHGRSAILLLPAALSLMAFAWLLRRDLRRHQRVGLSGLLAGESVFLVPFPAGGLR
jgi:drug/metabolite transporter superfamily protein YnfA